MSISGFFSYPLYPAYFNTLATKEIIFLSLSLTFLFWMVMFLCPHHTAFAFHS